MSEDQLVAHLSKAFSAAALQMIGFQWANQSNLCQLLSSQSVNGGGTAIWDSFLAGTQMLLELQNQLGGLSVGTFWKFVHIVLTDGSDNASKKSLQDACLAQRLIGSLIPVEKLKSYFILVDGTTDARNQLKKLSDSGGENSQFLKVDSTGLDNLFEKIKLELQIRNTGLSIQTKDLQLSLRQSQIRFTAQKFQYIVLFNIDVSGSMNESGKWQKVLRGVRSIMGSFDEGDLVAGLVFDTSVTLLTNSQNGETERRKREQAQQQEQRRLEEQERQLYQGAPNSRPFSEQRRVQEQRRQTQQEEQRRVQEQRKREQQELQIIQNRYNSYSPEPSTTYQNESRSKCKDFFCEGNGCKLCSLIVVTLLAVTITLVAIYA